MPLIFLLSQISEVSDYVSIKHVHCPVISGLIVKRERKCAWWFLIIVYYSSGNIHWKVTNPAILPHYNLCDTRRLREDVKLIHRQYK